MAEPIGSQLPHTGPNTRWADTKRRPAVEATRMKLMTVAEISSEMRVSRMTVYRFIHSEELPAVRIGRSFRVPERAFIRFMQARMGVLEATAAAGPKESPEVTSLPVPRQESSVR